jgi:hypothetical protein
LRATAEEMRAVVAASQRQEAQAERLLAAKEAEMEAAVARLEAAHAASVARAADATTLALGARDAAIEQTAAERDALKLELDAANAQLADVRTQRDELRAALQRLEDELASARTRFAADTAAMRAEFDASTRALTMDAEAAAAAALSAADAAQQLLSAQLGALRAAHTTLQCELERHITALAWNEEQHATETTALRHEMAAQQQAADVARDENEKTAAAERAELQTQLVHSNEQCVALTSDAAAADAHYRTAVAALRQQSADAARTLLETRCTTLEQLWAVSRTCRQLRAEMHAMRVAADDERAQWQLVKQTLHMRVSELETAVAARDAEAKAATLKWRHLQTQVWWAERRAGRS